MIFFRHKLTRCLLKLSLSLAPLISHSKSIPELKGEVLSVSQARKKWGEKPFSENAFRKAHDLHEKAQLAVSALRNQVLRGKRFTEVREALGAPDGYYFSDYVPAYIIHEGASTAGSKGEVWQLVFILDKERKVEHVTIHKNCCYPTSLK